MVKKIIIGTVVICTVGFVGLTVYNYNHVKPELINVAHGPTPAELLVDVNAERTKAGQVPLVEDPALDVSAIAKCTDMLDNNYKEHDSPQGRTWQSFFPEAYQTFHRGENLAWDYPDSQSVVNGWMASPAHRSNILDSTFRYVGYAVCGPANNTTGTVNDVVQHFRGEN